MPPRPEHAAGIAAMTATLTAEMKRGGDPLTSLTVASPKPAEWTPQSAPAIPAKKGKKKSG